MQVKAAEEAAGGRGPLQEAPRARKNRMEERKRNKEREGEREIDKRRLACWTRKKTVKQEQRSQSDCSQVG